MSLRIRTDGRVLCAAMHPEEPGDTYLHDGISYLLTVELRALVTEPMESTAGRGGHGKHGEWWWAHLVPEGVVIEGSRSWATLEMAWGVIANVGNGDWTTQSRDWQTAAEAFRDDYHKPAARLEPPQAAAEDYRREAAALVKRHDAWAQERNFERCGCENCTPFRALLSKASA